MKFSTKNWSSVQGILFCAVLLKVGGGNQSVNFTILCDFERLFFFFFWWGRIFLVYLRFKILRVPLCYHCILCNYQCNFLLIVTHGSRPKRLNYISPWFSLVWDCVYFFHSYLSLVPNNFKQSILCKNAIRRLFCVAYWYQSQGSLSRHLNLKVHLVCKILVNVQTPNFKNTNTSLYTNNVCEK